MRVSPERRESALADLLVINDKENGEVACESEVNANDSDQDELR